MTGKNKICTKCGVEKDISEFGKLKILKSGINNVCKVCTRSMARGYREKNKEKTNESARRRYNPQRRKEQYEKNKEKTLAISKKYYKENRAQYRITRAKWFQGKNKDDDFREYRRNNLRKHYKKNKNNPVFKLRRSVGRLVTQKLKNHLSGKCGKSTFDYLPYTVEQLIQRLEMNFQPGMTWENYGKSGWEMDHKKADNLFDYKSMDDQAFQDCWSLANFQPLWKKDNVKKSNMTWDEWKQYKLINNI